MVVVRSLRDDRELVARHSEHGAVLEGVADEGAHAADHLVARVAPLRLVDFGKAKHAAQDDRISDRLPSVNLSGQGLRHHLIRRLVLHAGERIQVRPAARRGELPLILLFALHQRVDVIDADDELRPALLLDERRLEAHERRAAAQHHPVPEGIEAVLLDLSQNVLFCEERLEFRQILRADILDAFRA